MNYASPFKRRSSPIVGYKLAAGGSAMDVEMGDIDIDENEMTVTFPFADGRRRDGVGDLLEIAGISCERHRKNPVVLFDHGKQVVLPVAMAEDPFTRQYTVSLDSAAKVGKVKAFFYQGKGDIGGQSADYEHSLFCHQLFDLIARKFVRGGSIGYQVVHARELTPDYERGTPKGLHLLQTLMLEASAVVMPANQDTVRKCLALPNVCGKPMSPMLVKSLTPYVTERKAMVTGGFSLPVEQIKSVRMTYRVKGDRKEGEVWQGDSGRWFTLKNGRSVPSPAPDSGQQNAPEQSGRPAAQGNRPTPVPDPVDPRVAAMATMQAKKANDMRQRMGKPPLEFELVKLKLSDVIPSQTGEDYDNASSRDLAENIGEFGESGRKEDYAPVAVDENMNIIDGNHRHAARAIAGVDTIDVLVPKGTMTKNLRGIKSIRMAYRVKAKDASYANTTEFEVGQKVIARSYIAYVNKTTRKTEPFAASGDRLELIEDNGSTFKVRRADGETTIVTRTDIRKKGLDTGIKSIRMKYRAKAVDAAPAEDDDVKAQLIAEILAGVFGAEGEKSLQGDSKAAKGPKRAEGAKWQGPSGRWFTMKKVGGKLRVAMTHAPDSGENGGNKPATEKKPGKPRKPATPNPIKLTMDQAREIVTELKQQGPTEDALSMLTASLATLTVKDLTQLKKELGIKSGKKAKADLIQKIKETLSITGVEKTPEPQEVPSGEEQGRSDDGAGSEATGDAVAGDGGQVAEEVSGPEYTGADQGGGAGNKPAGHATPRRLPAPVAEVNKKIDRFEQFFRKKGQGAVADWLGKVREHVQSAGVESALEALGGDPSATETGPDGKVQYWGVGTEEANWKNMGTFMEAYLDRNGIIAVTGDTSDPDLPLISALGAPDKYVAGQDFKPTEMHFKDKLTEAKTLPGLEKSEDIEKLTGRAVTHIDADVLKRLDETYGPGQWIVKCYDDNAAAGYGIFFPQRVAAIQQDARNTIWTAGENLARYGFQLDRDPSNNKIIGLIHQSGDKYPFGTDKYASTIDGDARYWADRAMAAADNEQGPKLPEGSFMAQPAFQAVGISDAERAAGKTWHEKNEGRVHLVTRPDGSVSVVPHSTWLKGGNLPVVFEDDDTRAMAKAAQDAIANIPLEARRGQVYAPDVMKTPDGYRVVELNAQGDNNGSGYLHDNHFTIDAYTSFLTGRQPAHVKFIRQLLTRKDRETTKGLKRKMGTKSLTPRPNDLKSIRMKYRKGMTRRIKRGAPTQSLVYTSEKDLPKIREAAKIKGVQCRFMGTHKSGMEKVKLTGDENAIDELGKTFGRYIKSLDGGGMNPDVMGDTDVMGMPGAMDAEPLEPHGASMLRRFHEDHSILMKDYHDAMQRLEPDSAVRKYIEKSLSDMEKALGGVEALFSKQYKDLPPLEGAMEVDVDGDGDMDVEAEEIPDPMDADAMPADSSPPGDPEEEDPVTMDDIEMKRLKGTQVKSGKYGRPGYPGIEAYEAPSGYHETYKDKNKSKAEAAAADMRRRGLKVDVWDNFGDWVADAKEPGKSLPNAKRKNADDMPMPTDPEPGHEPIGTNDDEPALEKSMKALEENEKEDVREACDFAKELSEAQTLEDDQRHKSFHYHKTMGKLCGVKNANPGTPPMSSDDFQKSMEDIAGDMHPHRKACSKAGDYFGRMAKEKAFGDAHREEAAACAAEMEKALSGEESTPADDMEGVEGMPEPGEMGEKLLASQAAKIGELEYKLKRLAAALAGNRR
jgi:hypothetical protein